MKENTKYHLLFETIKAEIERGVYQNGQRIPGENELSRRYSMSRQTVRQALTLLEQLGLVERKQGSGTYVKESLPRRKWNWQIGVVATYMSEYIFPSIMRGIEDELTQNGFSMVLSVTKNRLDSERRILENVLKKPVDGLIVEGTKSALPNPNLPLYEQIRQAGIPVVFFNSYYPVMPNKTFVVMDDKRGGYDATAYLASQGHIRIGGIFKSDDMQGIERYSGYIEGVIENKLPLRDEWVTWFHSENRNYFIQDEAERIVESLRDCTAVVCYNDEIGVKLINILHAHGYRIPEDKAIISFDNSLLSEVSRIKITSLDHPKEIMGAVAARKLVAMINGKAEKSSVMEWSFSKKHSG